VLSWLRRVTKVPICVTSIRRDMHHNMKSEDPQTTSAHPSETGITIRGRIPFADPDLSYAVLRLPCVQERREVRIVLCDDPGNRSRNGSKDAMGNGRTGWTGWDATERSVLLRRDATGLDGRCGTGAIRLINQRSTDHVANIGVKR
jgi:hypothetical protein